MTLLYKSKTSTSKESMWPEKPHRKLSTQQMDDSSWGNMLEVLEISSLREYSLLIVQADTSIQNITSLIKKLQISSDYI